MSSPLRPVEQLSRFLTRLAAVIAVLVTFLPPLSYLAYAWQEADNGLEHHSELQATIVTRFVTRNPGVWHYTRERLMEGLVGFAMPDQRTMVIDNARRTIGEFGPAPLKAPVFAREAPFHEFGVPAGVVRTETSMADNLKTAGLILVLSGALGVLVFVPLRRVPLAALADSVRRLEESEERFRRLTELSADWYWAQDTEHRFTFVSSGAKRSGFDVTAPIGRTHWEMGAGIPLEAWSEHRCLLDARKPFRDFEYATHSAAGDERWISISGEPTFDAQGRFSGYQGTARDQTPQRRAENILRNQKEVLHDMVERKTAELRAALEHSQRLREDLERPKK